MYYNRRSTLISICGVVVVGSVLNTLVYAQSSKSPKPDKGWHENEQVPLVTKDPVVKNAATLIEDGRNIFRYDTYGDEAFWGDALQLHQAIQGSQFGGVGPGVSPRTALALGLKVDSDALPARVLAELRKGQVNLDDVAVTLTLLKSDAVVGVKGLFNTDGSLKSVGLTCAVCHSTVNDSVAPGIGQRLDGWANHDLNTGAIIAAAPNLTPIRNLLQIVHPNITDDQIRAVLNGWGPGKFDAQLLFDGKAVRPGRRPCGDTHSQCFWPVGLQSPHLDRRLGNSDLLECAGRGTGIAWKRDLLRRATGRHQSLANRRHGAIWSHIDR